MTRQELYMQALEILSQEKKDVASEKIRQLMRENPEHEALLESILESNDESEPSEQYWRYVGSAGRLSMTKKNGQFINNKIFDALGFDAERHLTEKPSRGYVGRFIAEADSNIEPGKKYVLFEWESNGQMKQAVYNKSKFEKVTYTQDEDDYDSYDDDYEDSYSYSYDDDEDN